MARQTSRWRTSSMPPCRSPSGTAQGTFAPAPTPTMPTGLQPYAVALADLDRDGILDLLVATEPARSRCSSGTPSRRVTSRAPPRPRMPQSFVIDIRHYLDEQGEVPALPLPAMTIAYFCGSVVAWVSASPGPGRRTDERPLPPLSVADALLGRGLRPPRTRRPSRLAVRGVRGRRDDLRVAGDEVGSVGGVEAHSPRQAEP